MYANVVKSWFTTKRKVWEFPKERFVTYEAKDEAWARPLGFGKEVERLCETEIPRAVLTGITTSGEYQFTAITGET